MYCNRNSKNYITIILTVFATVKDGFFHIRYKLLFLIGHRQLLLHSSCQYGTAPVAAGIIINLYAPAVLTHTYIRTISSCFAVDYVVRRFCLLWRRTVLFKISWIKTKKDILNSRLIHVQPLGCQRGF